MKDLEGIYLQLENVAEELSDKKQLPEREIIEFGMEIYTLAQEIRENCEKLRSVTGK